MAYNRIYVDPINQPFRIELKKGSINADFTEVVQVDFEIKKPDGATISRSSSIISQTVDSLVSEYMLQAVDIDIPGSYQVVVKFLMSSGWWGASDRLNFIAENMFT